MRSRKSFRAFLIGPMLFEGAGGLACSKARARAAFRRSVSDLRPVLRGKGRDIVIAVDQGLEFCERAGIQVDLAVGDWDSLKRRVLLKRVPHITLPRHKDRSDLFYALGAAFQSGAKEIVLAGFIGGRLDHEFANILDAVGFCLERPKGAQVFFCAESCDCLIVTGRRKFRLKRFQVMSVFAVGEGARGVSLTGVRYPLREARLKPSSHGLSNVVTSDEPVVNVKAGALVVMVPRGQYDRSVA